MEVALEASLLSAMTYELESATEMRGDECILKG